MRLNTFYVALVAEDGSEPNGRMPWTNVYLDTMTKPEPMLRGDDIRIKKPKPGVYVGHRFYLPDGELWAGESFNEPIEIEEPIRFRIPPTDNVYLTNLHIIIGKLEDHSLEPKQQEDNKS